MSIRISWILIEKSLLKAEKASEMNKINFAQPAHTLCKRVAESCIFMPLTIVPESAGLNKLRKKNIPFNLLLMCTTIVDRDTLFSNN
jgi:hypothetical protein